MIGDVIYKNHIYFLKHPGHGLILAPCRGKTLTTLSNQSFYATAPKLWNDLPGSIRNTQSLNKFKKAINTFLFAKAF